MIRDLRFALRRLARSPGFSATVILLLALPLACLLATLLAARLYHVGLFDPLTLAGVTGLLGVVALAACWLPARRAASVRPIEALRYE